MSLGLLGLVVLGSGDEPPDDPLNQFVTSTVTITQDLSLNIVSKNVFTSLTPTQSVNVEKVLNRSVTSTVTPTQVLKRIIDISVSNTVSVTQSVVASRIKPVVSTVTITQSVVVNKVINRSILHAVIPQQVMTRNIVSNPSVVSNVTVTQSNTRIPVKFLSADSTVTITQELIRERIEQASNSLVTLSHSVALSKVYNISIAQTIHPTDLVSRNIVINRSITDQITFSNFRIVPYRIGGIIEVLLPSLTATKVHPKYMVMSVGSRAITLPAPEFGDRIGNTDLFTMSMSKTGRIYTTIKRSPSKNLNYEFDLFSAKAEELKEFLWEFNSEAIKIENWKGEIWYARLLTNPIDFRESVEHRDWCGGKVNVALDFEGLRIH